MGGVKVCNRCGVEKPSEAYQRKADTSDGLARTCRECDNARRRERKVEQGLRRPDPPPGHKWCSKCDETKRLDDYYIRQSGKHKGSPSAWCKVCVKADNTARDRARGIPPKVVGHPDARWHRMLRRHHITPEQYQELLDAQDGRCPGCGRTPEQTLKRFAVDHDHSCCPGAWSCGRCIRGLLCWNCNVAVGHAKNRADVLENLATYVRRSEACASWQISAP